MAYIYGDFQFIKYEKQLSSIQMHHAYVFRKIKFISCHCFTGCCGTCIYIHIYIHIVHLEYPPKISNEKYQANTPASGLHYLNM